MEGSMARDTEPEDIPKELKLVLGCGIFHKPGWTNLDIVPCEGVDVVHDLNVFPYPFSTSQFRYIYAQHVLEHLNDMVSVMNEIHRILKPGGRIEIIVPYYKSKNAFTDPTHKQFFTEHSMDYFIEGENKVKIDWYTEKRYKRIYFKKYNNGFPFWHIKQRTGIWFSTPFFADTLHWILEAIK